MYFLSGLLKNLDKDKYETFTISNSKNDSKSELIQNKFDNWINVRSLNDKDAINLLREKNRYSFRFNGFTSDSRLVLFKNRIAPIQISWLGYCNTTGIKEMDYLIADKKLIFKDEEKFYSEKIIKLNIWNAHDGYNSQRKKIESPAIKKALLLLVLLIILIKFQLKHLIFGAKF